MNRFLRLFGCERRARENLLRVYRWRIERAETIGDRVLISADAMADGVISDVQEMMDRHERKE